jgi:hypothetical protein
MTKALNAVFRQPGGGDGFFLEIKERGLGGGDQAEIDALAETYILKFVGPPLD